MIVQKRVVPSLVPRPRAFDEDRALWKAVLEFWRRGYQSTSIQNLVDAMGIERGSLYATFGDKEALFLKAIERYSKYQLERLPAGAKGADVLRAWFENNLADAASPSKPNGCLVIHMASESPALPRGLRSRVMRHLEQLEGFFRAGVVQGQDSGQISTDVDAAAAAERLLSGVVALNLLSRAGATRERLARMASQTLEEAGISA